MTALVIAALIVGHQDISASEKPWLKQLFPKLSGHNGFEEFVAAADMVRGPELDRERSADRSLSDAELLKARRKRISQFGRAIELVMHGIEKPCKEPRTRYTGGTLTPDLLAYKQLGRLFSDRAEVEFADGRQEQAVKTICAELRFGRAIGQGPMITELMVGNSIQTAAFQTLGDHIQTVPYACLRLLKDQAALGIMQAPRSLETVLVSEASHANNTISELSMGGSNTDSVLSGSQRNVKTNAVSHALNETKKVSIAEMRTLESELQVATPQARRARKRSLDLGVKRYLHELHVNLAQPESEWGATSVQFDNPVINLLWALTDFEPDRLIRSQAVLRCQYRLMAAHVAIGEYRHSRGVLPVSLFALSQPNVVTDSFTGKEFSYELNGTGYSLSSSGPRHAVRVALGRIKADRPKALPPPAGMNLHDLPRGGFH